MNLAWARSRLVVSALPVAGATAFAVVVALLVEQARLFVAPSGIRRSFLVALGALLILDLVRAHRPVARKWADRFGPYLFLALSLMATLGALHAVWIGVTKPYFAIGGLVPYSDASSYLRGARYLLEFGRTDVWATRRVLSVLLYAVTLFFTRQDLAQALWVVAALGAVTISLATNEVLQRLGFAAALVFWMMVVSFFDGSAGLFMTEPFGVIFGAVGFVFLVRGCDDRDRKRCLIGLLLLELSQSARPGAVFVVPLVAAYLVYLFHTDWRATLRWATAVAGAMIGVLVLLSAVQWLVTPPTGVSQASFAYTLYGLARGGLGWAAAIHEHPEILRLSDAARTHRVYALALSQIRAHPMVLVATLWKALIGHLSHPFAFLFDIHVGVGSDLLFIPAIAGCAFLATRLRRHAFGFIVPCLAGVFLSSPFLADGGTRVYASTIFVNAALAAVGCGVLIRAAPVLDGTWTSSLSSARWSALGLLGFGVTLGPLGLALHHALSRPCVLDARERALQASLPTGHQLMKIRNRPGSGFVVGNRLAEGDIHAVPRRALWLNPGARDLRAHAHLCRGCYFVSGVNALDRDSQRLHYFIFPRPPPFTAGYLTIEARILTSARYGHTLYAARVVHAR